MITEMLQYTIQSLTEGIMLIGFNGTILYANQAASDILCLPDEKLTGKKFISVFPEEQENDSFLQVIVDAISKRQKMETVITPYFTAEGEKHLRISISIILNKRGKPMGFTMVFNDLSGLMELQDAVKAMEHINMLNQQLEARNDLLNRTFGMFFSDEVVNELLNKPDGLSLGGKKRNLTVMMSDLRGFTAISERMDAQDLIDMLNHYFEKMIQVIQSKGGTIIELMGDGILAVFGAPVPSETHAVDAVAAALEMQSQIDEINEWNMEREYPHLEMGVGIDTGVVSIGNIGSSKRMKYGAVGKHVNLCSRIESFTVGGQILISSNTRDQIPHPLEIEKEITVLPKGAEEELLLYHVTGIGKPYDLRIKAVNDEMKDLTRPLPVCFFKLDKKVTMEKPFYGGILAIGRGSAVLETESGLELFDNLQMKAGGRLQCKVMEQNEGKYRLQYTYVPSGYAEWISEITAAGFLPG